MNIELIVYTISLSLSFVFMIYGYNCLVLSKGAISYVPPKSGTVNKRPQVAIHLPIYNEKYVVKRLLKACAEMIEQYGKDYVRVFVLDDSTDETSKLIDVYTKIMKNKGYKVIILRRNLRKGYKAGALQNALKYTEEEYIAIFDADFIPPKNFLVEVIPYIAPYPDVGIVQCRWGHVNRRYNWLTRCISIGIDGHFLIEQAGRYAYGMLLNFNGSAGIIRRSAIIKAGGWHDDTLAEDLDLSYRVQLNGYRVVYLRDVIVKGEVPPTITAFIQQQARWANGSLKVAKKLLLDVIKSSRLSLKQKLEASIHLTYYLVHPFLFLSFMLALFAAFQDIKLIKVPIPSGIQLENLSSWHSISTILYSIDPFHVCLILAIIVCTFSTWIMYSLAIKLSKNKIQGNFSTLLLLALLGFGISAVLTFEALQALIMNKTGTFKRTPKYNIIKSTDDWKKKKYQAVVLNKSIGTVICFALSVIAIYVACMQQNFGIIPILLFYGIAYALVGFVSLIQMFNPKAH